jgi:hypothetical protein
LTVATTTSFSNAAVCPFCSAVALTFSEQLDSNDVVVVAKLLEIPAPVDDPDADFPKAKFEIVRVVKGEKFVGTGMKFRTQLVGNYPEGQKFLVMDDADEGFGNRIYLSRRHSRVARKRR